jgi:hypothetical protein
MQGFDTHSGDWCDFRPAGKSGGFLPISPMTTLIQATAPLKGFPTEKTLRDFHAVRGMRFRGPIDIPAEQIPVLAALERNRMLDPEAWKSARINADVTPVFGLIADKMGYALASLLEGKGETGKPADSWTVYADEGKAPMLIRWTIGDGQLLMSIGILGAEPLYGLKPMLEVCLLADRKAGPHLAGINETLRRIEKVLEPEQHLDVSEGNVLKRVLNVADSGSDFSVTCVIHADAAKGLSDIRTSDYAELANSSNVIVEEAGTRRGFAGDLLVDEMSIAAREPKFFRFHYEAGRPVPADTLKLIHHMSVRNIQESMDIVFMTHLQDQREDEEDETGGTLHQEETPTIDSDLAERRLRLELNSLELSGRGRHSRGRGRFHVPFVMEAFPFNPPTVGVEFEHCPASVLLGTGPDLKMSGGDVVTSWDLLDLMHEALCEIPKEFPSARSRQSGIKITASIEAPAVAEQYKDTAPVGRKYVTLTNPFYAVHRGLPVRVDRSVTVWRANDTEALAADFFYAPESKELHVANLYRVKVPKG